ALTASGWAIGLGATSGSCHSFTLPSAEVESSFWPAASKCRLVTAPMWAPRRAVCWPLGWFQKRMVVSSPPDARRAALALKATAVTTPAWPVYWRSIWLLVRFQLRRILSLEPVMSFLASAERAAATTFSGCVSTRGGAGGIAHSFRVPSPDEVRSWVLFG